MLREATGSLALCLRAETGSIPVRSATGQNAKEAIGIPNPDVVGSIPTWPAAGLLARRLRDRSSSGRASRWQREGRGFDPLRFHDGVMVPFSEGHDSLTAVTLGGKLLVRTTSDARTEGPWTQQSEREARFDSWPSANAGIVKWYGACLPSTISGVRFSLPAPRCPNEYTSPNRDREAREALPKELQARPFSGRGSRIQGRLGGVLSFTARASRVVPGVQRVTGVSSSGLDARLITEKLIGSTPSTPTEGIHQQGSYKHERKLTEGSNPSSPTRASALTLGEWRNGRRKQYWIVQQQPRPLHSGAF